MIRQIITGQGLEVSNSSVSYPYISPGSNGAGMVRYNSSIQALEVNDGVVWQTLPNTTINLNLSVETRAMLQWVERKMRQEDALLELASTNEAVRLALENRNRAQEHLDVVSILAESK